MMAALALAATLATHRAATMPPCRRLPLAQQWLHQQIPHWQPTLRRIPGYQPPTHITVCALEARRPFADTAHSRIYVQPVRSSNDAVSIAHEYLHLAFADSPKNRDERFIEALARRLVREETRP